MLEAAAEVPVVDPLSERAYTIGTIPITYLKNKIVLALTSHRALVQNL
jgi:hypothetical protein